MSTPESPESDDRLTIVEMELRLTNGRLDVMDRRLDDLVQKIGRLGHLPEQADRIQRMVTEIVRHLGLGGDR